MAEPVFQVRGDSVNARRSSFGKVPVVAGTTPATQSDAGAIGGNSLKLDNGSTFALQVLSYPGRTNIPSTQGISVHIRLKTGYTGTPSSSCGFFDIGGVFGSQWAGRISLDHRVTSGNLVVSYSADKNSTGSTATLVSAWSPTSGTWYDIVLCWDGTTGSNKMELFIDGSSAGTATAGVAWTSPRPNESQQFITLGCSASVTTSRITINEFNIWSGVITPSSVTLTGGSGSLNGASRTQFVDATAFDGSLNTSAGAANIRSGNTTEVIAGVTTTGTMVAAAAATTKTGVTADDGTGTYDGSDRWTDPGEANVRSGTAYKANSTSNNKTGTCAVPTAANTKTGVSVDATTGTYDGSDRWSDPGVTNVRTSTAYKANSTTNNRTGTAAIPGASDVRSGTATDATTGTLVVPSLANTKTGVAGDGGTGTYDGSDRWSDPGEVNVASGVAYKANSTTNNKTGTLAVATIAQIRNLLIALGR